MCFRGLRRIQQRTSSRADALKHLVGQVVLQSGNECMRFIINILTPGTALSMIHPPKNVMCEGVMLSQDLQSYIYLGVEKTVLVE